MKPCRFTLIDLGAVAVLTALGLGLLIQPHVAATYQADFKKGHDASVGLLPKLQDKRNQDACADNLRLLGMMATLYSADNAGIYPGPDPHQWKDVTGPGWDEVLSQQTENLPCQPAWDKVLNMPTRRDDILACCHEVKLTGQEMMGNQTYARTHPGAKTLQLFACPVDPAIKTAECLIRSYGLNLGSADAKDGIAAKDAAIPVAKIESEARTVFLLEYPVGTGFGVRQGNYSLGFSGGTCKFPEMAAWLTATQVHGARPPAKVNSVMYDGHVELVSVAALQKDDYGVMQYIKKDR